MPPSPPRAVPLAVPALAICALVAFCGRAAGAEDPEALIREGITLRKAGDDSRAQGYFQRAYDLAKTPRSAAQLGLVEFALQLWGPAEGHLAEALRARDDSWIGTNRTALGGSLTDVRAHLGGILISGAPIGARVTVSGVDRGVLPLAEPVYVVPGPVIVSLSADGYGSLRRMVQARVGRVEDVNVRLPSLTAPAKLPDLAAVEQPPSIATAGSWSRPLAWGGAISAATLLALGGVALVLSNQNYADFNNRLSPMTTTRMCDKRLSDRGGSTCQQLLSAGDRDKAVAIVATAAGGALAIGSAVLFIVSSHESARPAHAVSCVPLLQVAAGAACAVRF